jgi:type IV pilus assembly protein PilB
MEEILALEQSITSDIPGANLSLSYMPSVAHDVIPETATAVSILQALIIEAHVVRASDVHLDPGEKVLTARLRVDGKLRDVHALPNRLHAEILARIKILAGLRTDEHQAPQDGRFRFELPSSAAAGASPSAPSQTIDIRVSIAPTYYGENAVLRLLASSDSLSTLSSLGCSQSQQALIMRALERPHGMILITGPTGSGKTSTLYALLRILNTREVSIITVEDPVEYALEGVVQIPIPADTSRKISFASGLRSILRQDPNIIGVGEIRDSETATLATNAALTGHLLLSTLHTTDAPTAIPRLMDLHIEPYLIASTLSLVISQRLVRRLCRVCRVRKPLKVAQKAALQRLFPPETVLMKERYESKGCHACKGSGSDGRMGLFEVLILDGPVREAALHKPSAHELRTLAVSQGMMPLLHDGVRKAAEGFISLDEVLALVTE